MYYDLHVHTDESDGKYSKLELLKYANEKKFIAIAFCDHNICKNINSNRIIESYRQRYNENCKTIIIPAIELDADNKEYRRIHILGYGILNAQLIEDKLFEIQKENVEITKEQIRLINKMYGTSLNEKYVQEVEGTKNISSKGLKKALIKSGIAKDIKDTYKFVSHTSPTHVNRKKISDIEAINIIKKSGGISILAHPVEICKKDTGEKINYGKEYEEYLKYLISCGLDGVESHTLKHNEYEKRQYFDINNKYQILSTAGTDFHDEVRTPYLGIRYQPEIFLNPLLNKIKERNSKFIKGDNDRNEER